MCIVILLPVSYVLSLSAFGHGVSEYVSASLASKIVVMTSRELFKMHLDHSHWPQLISLLLILCKGV